MTDKAVDNVQEQDVAFEASLWRRDWQPAGDQIRSHADTLRGLIGQRVTAGWVAWDDHHDRWEPNLPIIVTFEQSGQLEVSWHNLDDLSITWNTINPDVRPEAAWLTWPLSWRPTAHPALASMIGRAITQVAATEHLFKTQTIYPKRTRGTEQAVWLCSGLWLGSDRAGLHIFNALDENGLSYDLLSDSPDHRTMSI